MGVYLVRFSCSPTFYKLDTHNNKLCCIHNVVKHCAFVHVGYKNIILLGKCYVSKSMVKHLQEPC